MGDAYGVSVIATIAELVECGCACAYYAVIAAHPVRIYRFDSLGEMHVFLCSQGLKSIDSRVILSIESNLRTLGI